MPKLKKDERSTVVRRELPMPAYDYQKPQYGSFSVRYTDEAEKEKRKADAKIPALQHLTLNFCK